MAVYTIILATMSLSGLAVGLGSLYPNFQEDNPARIVSGMGGTLNLLLSIFYLVLVVGSQMAILQWNAMPVSWKTEQFQYALIGVLAFITVVSLVTVLLPMHFGLRNLIRIEI